MELLTVLHGLGGVGRTSTLRRAGFSERELRRAVLSGLLLRPRRGWIAVADADPGLVFAARHGVVLSCVTQARRLDLWVLRADEEHVAAPHPTSHVGWRDGVVHWAKPLLPRPPDCLVDPVENVLALVAACQPAEAALAVLDSALNRGLVTMPGLAELPIPQRFRELLARSSPYADSGLESLFRTRLSWLKVAIHEQAWVLGHRVDLLIGSRLIVQIDGATHRGSQRTRDILHDARVRMEGYHVVRFSYEQIVHRWEEVAEVILGAIARELHLAPVDRARRRTRGLRERPIEASASQVGAGLSGAGSSWAQPGWTEPG